MNQAPTQYEELSIATMAGLDVVAQNAEAQYAVGRVHEATLLDVGEYAYSEVLHEAMRSLRRTIRLLKEKITQSEHIGQTDAEELQHHYDRLVRLVQHPPRPKSPTQPVINDHSVTEEKAALAKPVSKVGKKETKAPTAPAAPRTNVGDFMVQRRGVAFAPSITASVGTLAKPKTGQLKVQSEKEGNIPVTNRSSQRTAKTKPEQPATSAQVTEVTNLVTKFRRQLESVKKNRSALSSSQQLMFEEAQEGIEQLETLAQIPNLTRRQFARVTDLVQHTKHSFQGLKDDSKTEPTVPVVVKGKSKKSDTRVSFIPTSVTTKKDRVAKRNVPRSLQMLPKPAPIHEVESLTERYLTAPKYRHFITTHYSSPRAFEQILDATITRLEADTIDPIERWLGELPASAFSLVKDMLVQDVITFSRRSYESVMRDLQVENVKYETFAVWRDLIDEMLAVIPTGLSLRYGQLFALYMIESEMVVSE